MQNASHPDSLANERGSNWGLPIALDDYANAAGGGTRSSLAVVSDVPSICYYAALNGGLRFIYASDALGDMWAEPVTVDGNQGAGRANSLAAVSGAASVMFEDADGDLVFKRLTLDSTVNWIAVEP